MIQQNQTDIATLGGMGPGSGIIGQNNDKLRNVKVGEKSLERNNSVFSRKDLIKKEYNKIMD